MTRTYQKHKSLPGQISFLGLNGGVEQQMESPSMESPSMEYQVTSGSLWRMGRHRLLCGNIGNLHWVRKLLGEDTKVHLVHANLPHDTSEAKYLKSLNCWLNNIAYSLLPGRCFYIWGGYSKSVNYLSSILAAGLHFRQMITWVKAKATEVTKSISLAKASVGVEDSHYSYEQCFYGWKPVLGHLHNSLQSFRPKPVMNTWYIPVGDMEKPNLPKPNLPKPNLPLEIPFRAISHSTEEGEIVLDPFAGSNSTIEAAEYLDRTCYAIERDTSHCSMILDHCKRIGLKIEKVE